ncbi:hypothetical protein EDD95_3820 [Streptomyces sp. CEV 2-1]|uniref:hypothetical protein n=1 Tax=unclassified Streptomyces TaxID=2593676 RepID=UPI000FC04878|nr:hypothetical protein [Streptomyces sp. CEV 2-1]ROQ77302.1 hypothetical protein EDD95_3820 [Streptomyces sp. CEV 2-1]
MRAAHARGPLAGAAGECPARAGRTAHRYNSGYYASRLALPGAAAERLTEVPTALPGRDRRRAEPE